MTTLEEVSKQEDCSEIVQGMYEDMFEFFESTGIPFVTQLQVKSTGIELTPIVRYIPPIDSRDEIDKLAIRIMSGTKALAREFQNKYKDLLRKDSKLVCNGIGTGGMEILELPNGKIRIRWYIGLIV